MPRLPLAFVALAAVLAAGCPHGWRSSCPAPDVVDCDLARSVRLEALRARAWMLDAESFGSRAAAQPGADRAAHFMAAELQSAGLTPAGDRGTFLQDVPLRVDEPRQPSVVLATGNVQLTLMDERDYTVLEARGNTRVLVDAELALVDGPPGDGAGWAKGRVGLIPVRTPQDLDRAPAAARALAARGAHAAMLCPRGPQARDTYTAAQRRLQRPTVRLADDAVPTSPAALPAAAPATELKLLLALAPPACEQLLAAAGGPGAARPVLPMRVRAQVRLVPRPAHGFNAVALYRPTRAAAGPPLLVAAPLDGSGLDLAGLLEIGRTLTLAARQPARPVLVLAYAAAAGAPVGLRHYRRHPTAGAPGPTISLRLERDPLSRAVIDCARVVQSLISGEGLLAGAAE
ncbi:MAG TPA: hypothetical protein VGQ83_24635 [Polyangia bacterium]|jgi:hypothetical protein